jgi:hypothetical protein
MHDGRQRISEIALFQRLLQIDRFDIVTAAIVRRQKALSHEFGLAEALIRGKGKTQSVKSTPQFPQTGLGASQDLLNNRQGVA